MQFTQNTVPSKTTLDILGASYGIDRLDDEPLVEYVERIHDRYRQPDNSTYDGLVSRIARKIGLMNVFPIEINVKAETAEVAIDGVTVTVLENSLTDSTAAWDDEELVGKIVQVGGTNYEIIENTNDTIYVNTIGFEDYVGTIVSPTYTIIGVKNPLVVITQSRIRLYSNYINDVISEIDFEMDIDKFTFLSEVVDAINSQSTSFSATVLPIKKYKYETLMARNLIPQSNIFVEARNGSGTKITKLWVNNIVDDTIVVTGSFVLINKKTSIEDVVDAGDYYVDRFNGTIYSATAIDSRTPIQYRYSQFPFRPKASLIIIDDIRDPEYNRMLFSQIPQDCYSTIDEQFKNGKPLDQFFIDYHLVNKINNIHWGK